MADQHLLLLDVGNTSTKVGLAGPDGLAASLVLPTEQPGTADSWGLRLDAAVAHALGVAPGAAGTAVSELAVSSVVPPVDSCLRAAADKYFKTRAVFVPRELPLAIENRYARPQEVGADRLVTAFAARRLFPEAQRIIIIDFGTATTFDCVDGDAYLGGLICPGVHSSARALASGTAKLPLITPEVMDATANSRLAIGRSTSQSLNHGFVYGFAAMAEGLCRRLRQRLGDDALVVATGGFAPGLAAICPCLEEIRPDLLLEGLRLAWLEAGGRF